MPTIFEITNPTPSTSLTNGPITPSPTHIAPLLHRLPHSPIGCAICISRSPSPAPRRWTTCLPSSVASHGSSQHPTIPTSASSSISATTWLACSNQATSRLDSHSSRHSLWISVCYRMAVQLESSSRIWDRTICCLGTCVSQNMFRIWWIC